MIMTIVYSMGFYNSEEIIMVFVIAPDSFKGSISSANICAAAKKSLMERFPQSEVYAVPMADGGEGTVDALISATGGKRRSVWVTAPLFDKTMAAYGILGDGKTAVIEMSSASGLPLVPAWKRDPFVTTTYGTGELIESALSQGCTEFILGIGGSATNDGGAGMVSALGARLLDANGAEIEPGARGLLKLDKIDISEMDPRIKTANFRVACDVRNPLCGVNGAAYIFGPQKGGMSKDLSLLDAALRRFGDIIHRDLGCDIFGLEGGGAAGGMGAGLVAFLDAKLMPGFEIVSSAVEFEGLLEATKPDYVITGEGQISKQSLMGKLPVCVAQCAKKYGATTIAIVGSRGEGWKDAKEAGIDFLYEIKENGMTLEYAMRNAEELIFEKLKQIPFKDPKCKSASPFSK